MSAFVVSHDHIDALLTFADRKKMRSRLSEIVNDKAAVQLTWTQLGQVLLAENERSVCERYPDCTPGTAPGTIGEEALTYRFKPFQEFWSMQYPKMIAWVLKGCDCFDYQACETDDYPLSIAFKMISAIRREAIRSFADLQEAPWEINRKRRAA